MIWDTEDRYRNVVPLARPEPAEQQAVVLTVGEVAGWSSRGKSLPSDKHLAFAEIYEVGADLLETLRPDIVLSPLLSGSFDCIDLAQILQENGYRGRYRVLAPKLPSPDLIRREIQSMCPDVQFDIIQIDDLLKLTR